MCAFTDRIMHKGTKYTFAEFFYTFKNLITVEVKIVLLSFVHIGALASRNILLKRAVLILCPCP